MRTVSTSATPHRRAVRAVVLAVGAATVLAASACGTDEPDTGASVSTTESASATPTVSPTAPESPEPTPSASATGSDLEGFTTDAQRSAGWPELGPRVGTGTAVRIGRHEGYDRVVYEFTGDSAPAYEVQYVDEPKDAVSGDSVDVPGEAYLSVGVTTVEIPAEDDAPPTDPSDADLGRTVVTYAPAIWGGFEGHGDQFIGVRGERRPFRVSTLSDPSRLVVDIAR